MTNAFEPLTVPQVVMLSDAAKLLLDAAGAATRPKRPKSSKRSCRIFSLAPPRVSRLSEKCKIEC